MSNFDERSGIVACTTPWGLWYQTIEEVYIEMNVPEGTISKQINIIFARTQLTCVVRGEPMIKGQLSESIVADECTWSLEDRKLVRIVLSKSRQTADYCWKSLLTDQYDTDPMTYDEMEKKLTLEKFQKEHPGFDFSGAEMSGNYSGGGPQFMN